MGFWGWYFIICAGTGLVLVIYFWIRWYQLINTMHRDARDARLNEILRQIDLKARHRRMDE